MFYLLVLLAVVFTVGAVATRYRSATNASLAKRAIRVGGLIAVVRLSVFWTGLALYTGHSDLRQSVGYLLLIVSSVAEFAMAAAWTGNRSDSSLLVAGLIVLTSGAIGWGWAWIRVRSSVR